MATHPKLVRHKPLDVWSLRERLMLASSVLQSGDQNWVSVSRAIRNQSTESRPHEYFSQKNCALQYGELLEKAETPKRKRSDKNEVIPVETQGLQIVNKLKLEYMEQLVQEIKKQQQQYQQLAEEIEMVSSGHCDEKLADIWEQIKKKQQTKEEVPPTSTSQSEAAPEQDVGVSSQSTSVADKEDTSTLETQEADIEVQVDDSSQDVPTVTEQMSGTTKESTASTGSVEKPLTNPVPEIEVNEPSVAMEISTQSGDDIGAVSEEVENKPEEEETVETLPSAELAQPNDSTQTCDEESQLSKAPAPTVEPEATEVEEDSANEECVDVEVMPKPADPPSQTTTPESVSKAIEKATPDKKVSQLTVSVVPAELERALSPENSVVAAAAEIKPSRTPSVSGRRRSSRVVAKPKEELKKEEVTASSPIPATPVPPTPVTPAPVTPSPVTSSNTKAAASEVAAASDDEELPAPTSKGVDSAPNSPSFSQQSENEDDKTHKAWKKTIMMAWRVISQHKYANVFMHQVTDDIAPSYSKCILRPMSLSVIKQNVEKNVLRTTDEFSRDMMLMFVNAIMYNNHEYDVYAMAQEMFDKAMTTIKEHTQNTGKESNIKSSTLRERRSDAADKADKETDKSRRRSSAEQHSDSSQPSNKRRKTRADN